MSTDFENCWRRVKQEAGLKSQKELAELLMLTPSAVTDMKKTGKFPEKWAKFIEAKLNLRCEWILKGEGPRKLHSNKKYNKYEILNELEEWLDELIRIDPNRKQWFQVEIEDKIPLFKEWKKNRNKNSIDLDDDQNFSHKKQVNNSNI